MPKEDNVNEEVVENVNEDNVDSTEETDSSPGADSTTTVEDEDDKKIPYSRFKDKVDEVNRLKAQLSEFEKSQEEARNKELEEQGKYKELYEEAMAKIDEINNQGREARVTGLLKEAGYSDEQVNTLRKLVEGDDDEAIEQSIETIKVTFPTKTYVDPSPDNRKKQRPDPVDGEEVGRNMFERLINSGRLKGHSK